MPRVVNWIGRMPDQSRRAFQSAKEQNMRKHLLAISAILAAMSAPIAAQAQSDTVGVRGGAVVVDENGGIAVDQRPAFREYVIRERVPNYTIPDRVIVGGRLPETGLPDLDAAANQRSHPSR